MKNIFWSIQIGILIGLITPNAYGQSYHPFLKQGKKWRIFYYSDVNCPCNGCTPLVNGKLFSVSGDTIVNGTSYSKISESDMQLIKVCPAGEQFNYINTRLFGYYYEDTIMKRVYSLINENTQWENKLEYDFGLQVGDSIPYSGNISTESILEIYPLSKGDTSGYLKVSGISTIAGGNLTVIKSINFADPKRFTFTHVYSIVEGIGGIVLFKTSIANYFESRTEIDCVTENNSLVSNGSGIYNCANLYNLVLAKDDPEPMTESFPPQNFTTISVTDVMGREIVTLKKLEEFTSFCYSHKKQIYIFQAHTISGGILRKILFSD